MGFDLSKPRLRAELEADLKRWANNADSLHTHDLFCTRAGFVKELK